jgi:AraC-like DNA-binding protein
MAKKINIVSGNFGYLNLHTRWVDKTISDGNWRFYQNDREGANVFYNNKKHPILPYEIFIIPAWTIWYGEINNAVFHSHLSFTTPSWSAVFCRKYFPHLMIIKADHENYKTIHSCFEYLRAYYTDFNAEEKKLHINTYVSKREAALYLILSTYLEKNPPTGEARPNEISNVLDYIDENLSGDLRVEQLAKIQLCATAHFSRLFSKLMTQSPSEYVRERRITKAAQLLIYTDKTIEQIAEMCGFYDRFHFSKIFKSVMKRSPVSYKKVNLIS